MHALQSCWNITTINLNFNFNELSSQKVSQLAAQLRICSRSQIDLCGTMRYIIRRTVFLFRLILLPSTFPFLITLNTLRTLSPVELQLPIFFSFSNSIQNIMASPKGMLFLKTENLIVKEWLTKYIGKEYVNLIYLMSYVNIVNTIIIKLTNV